VIHAASGDPSDMFPTDTHGSGLSSGPGSSEMSEFYRPLGAYTVAKQESPGDRPELHLVAAGYPRAGVLEIERANVPSTMAPYVRVKDLNKTVAKHRAPGGPHCHHAEPGDPGRKVAVFLDPAGAAIAWLSGRMRNTGEGKP